MDGTHISALPMDLTAPAAQTLYNYDTDRAHHPGLLLHDTDDSLDETNPKEFQAWRTAPLDDGLVITGDVYVTFFAAVEHFEDEVDAKVDVFLRDYDGVGGYTEIAMATAVEDNWQQGSETFVEKTVAMAAVDYVVPPRSPTGSQNYCPTWP